MTRGLEVVACALLVVTAPACTSYAAPFETAPPRPNPPTQVTQQLTELPPPREKVVAGVYRFRDQTGQYKPSPGAGTSFSTAVTQGATALLIGALEDSGWFVPIEREGLSNLLNERQIIQQIRAQYEGPDGPGPDRLPPLLFAGVLLEGGIIGFSTNTRTGGLAARYFGAGGSAEFREDQVTVYLRAVSTRTGRVLRTVHATKTILSQKLDVGVFRFVKPNRLLEAEIGYSFNEPTTVAVREAIEESVRALVVEGIDEGLWGLQNQDDLNHPALLQYRRDRSLASRTDRFDRFVGEDRGGIVVDLTVGAHRYQGNYRDPLVRPVFGAALRRSVTPSIGVGIDASVGKIGATGAFKSFVTTGGVQGRYHLLPRATTSPFLEAGAGLLAIDLGRLRPDFGRSLFPYAAWGGGIEHMADSSVGLNVAFRHRYALMDGLDGVTAGSGHDSVWYLTAGVTLY